MVKRCRTLRLPTNLDRSSLGLSLVAAPCRRLVSILSSGCDGGPVSRRVSAGSRWTVGRAVVVGTGGVNRLSRNRLGSQPPGLVPVQCGHLHPRNDLDGQGHDGGPDPILVKPMKSYLGVE